MSKIMQWQLWLSPLACVVLALVWTLTPNWLVYGLVAVALIAAVLVAVHHAEVIAHRVGEPFGTLVLALAVTVIELGLIGSIMLAGGEGVESLARDTVFATVMTVLNGVVGLCLVVGSLRHHTLVFRGEGVSHALSVLAPLTVLALVLPTHAVSAPGPVYTPSQLIFAGLASLLLYIVFVFVQAHRHRDYFLPVETDTQHAHAPPPTKARMWLGLLLLLVALVAVIGLAKKLSPGIETGVAALSAPASVVGVVIAMLVLLPETWAALRAAKRNQMQTSLNLALGSALATIGLTIPAVALFSTLLGLPLELGLPAKDTVLLGLSLLVATITLGKGRSTLLHGSVHLILFFAFLFFAVVP